VNMANHSKELQDTYSKIAEQYVAVRDNMLLIPELESFISLLKGVNVLDAGCGPGRDTHYFLQRGLRVIGIDFTERFISIAKQRVPNADFREMDILNLQFHDSLFNGIWSCAVLSHLKKAHLPIALSGFYKILQKDGILFMSVKLGNGEKVVKEALFDNNPRFTSFFQKREITNFLRRNGFKVIKLYTFNERERFGQEYRDLDYIVTFSIKN
jgi:SAM-dependent methyltransferase